MPTWLLGLALLALAGQGVASSTELPPNCFVGSYRNGDQDVAPWIEGCPGYSACEPGFWCDGVSKHNCPAGRYGSSTRLSQDGCSGPCDAGHLCPTRFDSIAMLTVGSVSATELPCGGSDVYCTEGLFEPISVSEGYYTTGNDDNALNTTRTGQELCPIGWSCADGIREPCPAGRYGDVEGETNRLCAGVCEAGYFCPAGSVSPQQNDCGRDPSVFCPPGSDRPQPVRPGLPIYDIGGTGGYFTHGGPLDDDAANDNDESLVSVRNRVAQERCPLGHYCVNGVRHQCPAGRYGNTHGQTLSTCTGICERGYYCPPASVDPRQIPCGADDLYCPEGSALPTAVTQGYYTVGDKFDVKYTQLPCPAGSYCVGGLQYLCNAGFWGGVEAQSDPDCSGRCDSGYFCEQGSTDPREHECGGAGVFCVEGSAAPFAVFEGYYTVRIVPDAVVGVAEGETVWLNAPSGEGMEPGARVLSGLNTYLPPGSEDVAGMLSHPFSLDQYLPQQFVVFPPDGSQFSTEDSPILARIDTNTSTVRNWERRCDEGHYCVGGERFPCPPGTFGDERGLFNASCSGLCDAGFYCPVASRRRDEFPCGGTDVYCPVGSLVPIVVQPGYYTIDSLPHLQEVTRSNETICPAGHYCINGEIMECPPGRYGHTEGLMDSDCTGPCAPGFYCPAASVNSTQVPCGGVDMWCPEGSGLPRPVREGYYTAGGLNTDIPADQIMACRQTYSTALVFDLQGPLDIEFDVNRFCIAGVIGDNDTRSYETPCEPGHFCVGGLRYECTPGRYGESPGESSTQCSGPCDSGFYCPWASTSPEEEECGGPHLYCPERSGIPTDVDIGYYTNIDRPESQRDSQTICEPGHYCVEGLKYACAPSLWGGTFGLHTEACSGQCSPGFYCPVASVSPEEVECGGSHLYCPFASAVPTEVTEGYWTLGGVERVIGRRENTTRYYQEICPVGHYCEAGIKYQCPAGTYGGTEALTSSTCSGLCAPGYFCPPGSTNITEMECGDLFVSVDPTNITEVTRQWLQSTHLGRGVAVGAGSAGAGQSGANQLITDPDLLIPWYSGSRVKLPTVEVHIQSDASIHNLHLDSGPSSVYCPEGSDWPTPVRQGYYTIGGNETTNTTRVTQVMCETGFYCIAGRKYPCSPGTFGRTLGLSRRFCTAQCPAGSFCPINSTLPMECATNTYSTGGAWECTACPSDPLPGRTRCTEASPSPTAAPPPESPAEPVPPPPPPTGAGASAAAGSALAGEDCPVCFTALSLDSPPAVRTACGHLFCLPCLAEVVRRGTSWVAGHCPICRAVVFLNATVFVASGETVEAPPAPAEPFGSTFVCVEDLMQAGFRVVSPSEVEAVTPNPLLNPTGAFASHSTVASDAAYEAAASTLQFTLDGGETVKVTFNADSSAAVGTRGATPVAFRQLLPSVTTPLGSVYVQGPLTQFCLGVASYHLNPQPQESYISYDSAPSTWLLSDGSPPPTRKVFESPSYDEATRTFTGTIRWAPLKFGGHAKWDYRMVFGNNFETIAGGSVAMFVEEDDADAVNTHDFNFVVGPMRYRRLNVAGFV